MRTYHVYSIAVLAAFSGALFGAPPALDIPAEVKPAGEYVRFSPKTDAVGITYIGLSGLDAFPNEELKDQKRFLFHTRGVPAGRYKFAAVASSATGEQTRADFTVVVGDAPVPPVPVPPGPTPPGPVPPIPPAPAALTAPVWIFVVEETGTRTVAAGRVIGDAAMWTRLNAAGNFFKVFDRSDPAVALLKLDTLADATGLPAVVARDKKGNQRAFKLPQTSAELETTVKGLVTP